MSGRAHNVACNKLIVRNKHDYYPYGGNNHNDNNFSADPPNAVISVLLGEEDEDITVVLTEPQLEGADLVYNVEVLDGSTSINGGAAALFIDVVGRPLTPVSVAGVARRTTRRTVRRRM